jgi:hypothetical protein
MPMTFIREYDSKHNLYQTYKLDGVTPIVGGQVIIPKKGVRTRGGTSLSYVRNDGMAFMDTSNPRFIPHEKPNYDVNDPDAGWVSYSSTRRGGFRPYNMRRV